MEESVDHLACEEILTPIEHYRTGLITIEEMASKIDAAILDLTKRGVPGFTDA